MKACLNSPLSPTQPNQALVQVPVALRLGLGASMRGKTEYQDEAGRCMIYAANQAAGTERLTEQVHANPSMRALPYK